MEIQTISRSLVKPSSQTPPHLKTYNLSGIDQINPSLYGPIILFYAADPTQQPDRRLLLKQSLSHTLSRYYPLAGKLKDSLSVDCCDAGAFYSKAKIVNSTFYSLSQFLDQLDLSTLRALFPIDAVEGGNILAPPPPGSRLLLVQETSFPCGGVSIGLLVAHDLLDAFSIASFVADWSATARRIRNPAAGGFVGNPMLVGGAIFPQNEALFERLVSPGPSTETPAATVGKKRRSVTRRFVFRSPELASLKHELTRSTATVSNINPTRVEAVTAVLCSSILRSFKSTGTAPPPPPQVTVTQAVNLRRKANPPFPPNLIGNYVINAVANLPTTPNTVNLTMKALRDSVSKIDAEFVEEIRGEEGKSRLAEAAAAAGGGRRISFTSWSQLGFYEADFGSGKPIWVGFLPNEAVVDLVMICDTRDGSGLEAWVFLEEDEMAVVEGDDFVLSFCDLDPSPNVGCDDLLFMKSAM